MQWVLKDNTRAGTWRYQVHHPVIHGRSNLLLSHLQYRPRHHRATHRLQEGARVSIRIDPQATACPWRIEEEVIRTLAGAKTISLYSAEALPIANPCQRETPANRRRPRGERNEVFK